MRRAPAVSRVAAVHQATQAAERKRLRRFEHEVDNRVRLHRGRPTHGLFWFEETRDPMLKRHACVECGREACRRWIGVWYEYELAPGRTPYALCMTPPLCAPCTAERQTAETAIPIWRPAGWRQLAAVT